MNTWRRLSAFGMLWMALVCGPASAQAPSDPVIATIRSAYDAGKYEQALRHAKERIDRGALSEDDLVELHRFAGLSAFNLGERDEAARHFSALLKLNPDYNLDPFAVAPPAIAFYEQQRTQLGATLDVLRERRAERKLAEDTRRKAEEEEQRRRMEELTRGVTVRTVERQSMALNFVPFGAGQFQQGRTAWGWAFALAEVGLAATSLGSFLAYQGLIREHTLTVETSPGQRTAYTLRGIPESRQGERDTLNTLKVASGMGFYAVYALGVADALWHHQDTVERTRVEPSKSPLQALRAHGSVVPGGVSAGLSFAF